MYLEVRDVDDPFADVFQLLYPLSTKSNVDDLVRIRELFDQLTFSSGISTCPNCGSQIDLHINFDF